MSKQNRSEFRAGLFIIVTLLLIGGIVVGIKGVRSVFTPVVQRKVHFALSDDVGGLRLGDDVRLGGYKIGVIRKIEVVGLDDGQKPGIDITFTAPKTYPLHENAHMAVQGTLTGSTWLNINDLGSGTLLADDGSLTGYPSAMTELTASLGKAAPDLQRLIHDAPPEIQGLLHDARSITLPKVNAALDRGADAFKQVGGVLSDTKPDIRATMANLNAVTTSAKIKLPTLLDHADSALVKLGTIIDSARIAMEDVKATMVNAREMTASARGVLVGNRAKFDGMIAALKATSDNLKGASAEIRRSPWRILYKPAPGEMDNLTLFDAARQFADGANNVNDAAQALRDAMQNPNVDHDQVQKLVNKLNDTFDNFSDVEQKLWKAVK